MNSQASLLSESAPIAKPVSLLRPLGFGTRRRCHVAIGLIGPGRVGRALLSQLQAAQERLLHERGLRLTLGGVIDSRRMCLNVAAPFTDQSAAAAWHPGHLDAFTAHVRDHGAQHAVLVDCTAHETIAARYPAWLSDGIHVVTPNKLAGSGPLPRWQAIRAACASGAQFRYETTVCAGLPVVQTLRDLCDTGDTLHTVEGMFSGTLAWLCNRYDGSRPFSALLREAQALGYTEPDPRDDLSGLDVARKLVILAREAGWAVSLEEVAVQNLLPASMASLPLSAFWARLDALDALMAAQLQQARADGGVLRHVARLDQHGRASVGFTVLPATHPFAHTQLTDTCVQFRSQRYCDNPLLVQGPGAGPEVTAAGVFADLLRIAESLETCS